MFGICRRLFETSKQLFEMSTKSYSDTQPEQTKHSDTRSHAARTDKALRHAFTRSQSKATLRQAFTRSQNQTP